MKTYWRKLQNGTLAPEDEGRKCIACGKILTFKARHKECFGCRRKRNEAGIPAKRGRPFSDIAGTPLYQCFMAIKYRCTNPRSKAYKNYGGRGIECRFDSARHFIDWALASGYSAGLTIDRIDNNGHYSPENCRWANMKTQNRNKRSNVVVTIGGKSACLMEWCERQGLNYYTVQSRRLRGETISIALGLE